MVIQDRNFVFGNLVTWLLALPGLIISKTKSRFIIIVYMGMLLLVLVIMIIGFLIIELILHPMISYMLVVPALAILLAYMICSRPNNSNGMLFVYFVVCLVLYSLFILILPINIFRKINPQFTFIPILSSIVVQLATNYKDLIFNFTMNGMSYKASSSFFRDNFMPIKSKTDFIKCLYEMYVYLFVERKTIYFITN